MLSYFIEYLLPFFTLVYIVSTEIKNYLNISNITYSNLLVNDSLLLTFCD